MGMAKHEKWFAQAIRDLDDLVELGYLIRDELGLDVTAIIDDLRALTMHYATSRYPDAANAIPFEVYTKAYAERANRVIEWVRQNLQLRARSRC